MPYGSRLSAAQPELRDPPGALAISRNTNTTLTFDTPVGRHQRQPHHRRRAFQQQPATSVTGAIQGVTLNLVGQSPRQPQCSQLTVGPDQNQITTAVNNFVSAYNTVVSTINTQYVVDPTGATPAPPLESDHLSALAAIQHVDRRRLTPIGGNSGYGQPGLAGHQHEQRRHADRRHECGAASDFCPGAGGQPLGRA